MERFAGVKAKAGPVKAARFCDRTFPAQGPEARPYRQAPTRPLGNVKAEPSQGWRWINVWATWCGPCVEEMGLLSRWRDALRADGQPVSFSLWSIDEPEAETELRKWLHKNLAGPVHWLRSEEDLAPWLESLGVDKDASIPIHALVDAEGQVRCVRVGAVHEEDYGAVRQLLRGG